MAMTQNDRERQHRARLAQIDAVQVVAGCGDLARVNHERTVIERARMFAEEIRSHAATERGLQAFDRLLRTAEDAHSPHAAQVAMFIESLWNGKPLALGVLRGVDRQAADDMIEVLDAWRYARLDFADHVNGGARRVSIALRAARARC